MVFIAVHEAGGVGLNLVAATRLYLLDLWWNPAVEEQAIQRVHRIGQTQEANSPFWISVSKLQKAPANQKNLSDASEQA